MRKSIEPPLTFNSQREKNTNKWAHREMVFLEWGALKYSLVYEIPIAYDKIVVKNIEVGDSTVKVFFEEFYGIDVG